MTGPVPAIPPLAGPLTSPPALLFGLLALLVAVFLGRIVLGVAWRLLLVAIVVVVGIWLFSALRTLLVAL